MARLTLEELVEVMRFAELDKGRVDVFMNAVQNYNPETREWISNSTSDRLEVVDGICRNPELVDLVTKILTAEPFQAILTRYGALGKLKETDLGKYLTVAIVEGLSETKNPDSVDRLLETFGNKATQKILTAYGDAAEQQKLARNFATWAVSGGKSESDINGNLQHIDEMFGIYQNKRLFGSLINSILSTTDRKELHIEVFADKKVYDVLQSYWGSKAFDSVRGQLFSQLWCIRNDASTAALNDVSSNFTKIFGNPDVRRTLIRYSKEYYAVDALATIVARPSETSEAYFQKDPEIMSRVLKTLNRDDIVNYIMGRIDDGIKDVMSGRYKSEAEEPLGFVHGTAHETILPVAYAAAFGREGAVDRLIRVSKRKDGHGLEKLMRLFGALSVIGDSNLIQQATLLEDKYSHKNLGTISRIIYDYLGVVNDSTEIRKVVDSFNDPLTPRTLFAYPEKAYGDVARMIASSVFSSRGEGSLGNMLQVFSDPKTIDFITTSYDKCEGNNVFSGAKNITSLISNCSLIDPAVARELVKFGEGIVNYRDSGAKNYEHRFSLLSFVFGVVDRYIDKKLSNVTPSDLAVIAQVLSGQRMVEYLMNEISEKTSQATPSLDAIMSAATLGQSSLVQVFDFLRENSKRGHTRIGDVEQYKFMDSVDVTARYTRSPEYVGKLLGFVKDAAKLSMLPSLVDDIYEAGKVSNPSSLVMAAIDKRI